MNFIGIQKTLTYRQINNGNITDVFPLLCPVREKDWIYDWDYKMIHSDSGLIEKNCVFTTPHHGDKETVWHVTQYDKEKHLIEFLRITPEENVVRINIELKSIDNKTTEVNLSYQYTGLNKEQNKFIEEELDQNFNEMMTFWEKAINYYLETGKMFDPEKETI